MHPHPHQVTIRMECTPDCAIATLCDWLTLLTIFTHHSISVDQPKACRTCICFFIKRGDFSRKILHRVNSTSPATPIYSNTIPPFQLPSADKHTQPDKLHGSVSQTRPFPWSPMVSRRTFYFQRSLVYVDLRTLLKRKQDPLPYIRHPPTLQCPKADTKSEPHTDKFGIFLGRLVLAMLSISSREHSIALVCNFLKGTGSRDRFQIF